MPSFFLFSLDVLREVWVRLIVPWHRLALRRGILEHRSCGRLAADVRPSRGRRLFDKEALKASKQICKRS
jgi:hypothetical protein